MSEEHNLNEGFTDRMRWILLDIVVGNSGHRWYRDRSFGCHHKRVVLQRRCSRSRHDDYVRLIAHTVSARRRDFDFIMDGSPGGQFWRRHRDYQSTEETMRKDNRSELYYDRGSRGISAQSASTSTNA